MSEIQYQDPPPVHDRGWATGDKQKFREWLADLEVGRWAEFPQLINNDAALRDYYGTAAQNGFIIEATARRASPENKARRALYVRVLYRYEEA